MLFDYRNPASVEHNVHELVSQLLYNMALGYEDLNDHGELRGDALLSLLVANGRDGRRAGSRAPPRLCLGQCEHA